MVAKKPVPDVSTLAGRIAYMLNEKRWTQGELSRRTGITRATISRHISGDRESPDTEILQKYADALGCDFRWLATGHGGPQLSDRAVVVEDMPPELERVLAADPPIGRRGTSRGAVNMALESYRSDGAARTEEEWIRLLDDCDHVVRRHQKIGPRIVRGDETRRRQRRPTT